HLPGRRRCFCGGPVRVRPAPASLRATRHGARREPSVPRTSASTVDHMEAVLARADAPHEINARDIDVLIACVDAESELGAAIDHRVRRVLRDLPNRLAEEARVSLDAVAASVGLSPSRFLHLFTRSVGVPLRPYVLWLRLQYGAG